MILLSCNWQKVIDATSCLCWSILIVVVFLACLVGFYLYLKYVRQPKDKHRFEEESKRNAFERELHWDERKEEKAKIQKEIDELKKQLKDLQEAVYGQDVETINNKDV